MPSLRFIPRLNNRRLLWIAAVLGFVMGAALAVPLVVPGGYQTVEDIAKVFWSRHLRGGVHYRFNVIRPDYLAIDVERRINVRSAAAIEAARRRAIDAIWGEPGFPKERRPDRIEKDFRDPRLSSQPEVAHIDVLDIEMGQGFRSRPHHLRPHRPNGKLVLYHEGHTGTFHRNAKVLLRLLADGYDVVAFSMFIFDAQPVVDFPGIGPLHMDDFGRLAYLDHYLQYFFTPVATALNHLLATETWRQVSMVGFSGGGWVTTVYAAIDPRVERSFPVAGTYPLYLRRYRNWGAPHETYPPLLRAANYLDLYIMGSHGPGRSQLQVLNQYDACCYSGLDWQTYEGPVQRAVREAGPGSFKVFLDSSHADHRLSTRGLDAIRAELARD